MAYNATYTTNDIAPMAVDFGLTALAALVGFATLVGLILIYRWARGKKLM